MIVTALRALILFMIVFAAVRLMGKRELGQLQPYEFVIAIMIANLASVPMAEMGIPILNGIVPILTLLLAHVGLTLLSLKNKTAQRLICGTPTIIISKGYILEAAMRSAGYSFSDLMEQLRVNGYFSLSDVEYAILETSGQISVIPKGHVKPVVARDLNLQAQPDPLPWSIIVDGSVQYDELRKSGRDMQWLKAQLAGLGFFDTARVLYASVDEAGQFFAQGKAKGRWWQF
jgi:uncharacterized membrane protein YcaP (DUF421 family)